jgi:hypothetical protein
MDVIDLVQKQNPDFGREALLEAFVNAHFNETTGELLGEEYEFQRVLHLLGRKDLNLGDIPKRIGKISFEEKQAVHIRFLELKRSAPKSKKTENNKNPAGPYLQHLTQTELMALEAFDSSGDVVANPAVATTLVQAHLEGWMPVAALPMDAKEILMQCMNQGDMQAAYLLGVKHDSPVNKYGDYKERMNSDENIRYLIESDEERLAFLTAAKAHGNPAAINWFEQKEMQEEMYESIRGDDDKLYENWLTSDIERALKFGPDSTGQKQFRWGIKLLEANRSHCLFSGRKNWLGFPEYRSRHELACQWIVEAAKSNAEARYYLAKNSENFNFLERENVPQSARLNRLCGNWNGTEIDKERELVRSAAFPGDGIEPYYPAFIDLAEQALFRIVQSQSNETRSTTDFDEVLSYLVEGVDHIEKPDCKQAIRIASLWESIPTEGHIERAIHYYSLAAKDSSLAAYKCAICSLRTLKPGDDTSLTKIKFDIALNAPLRHGEQLDVKAREYSDIALKIGWVFDSEPASWEEPCMLLMQQIDKVGYKPQKRNTWILPSDVDLLLQHSPSYERYKQWIREWRMVLTEIFQRHEAGSPEEAVQSDLEKKIKGIYLLYGKSEPASILRLLSAMANDPEYLHSAHAMKGIDASSILIKFLFSHLTLLQENGQGKALGEFKEVLGIAEAMQNAPGGRGVSFMATSLQWLQKKSLDGISDAQPNCRRVPLGSEMNGAASDFGCNLLNVVLQSLENGAIPGESFATEVIYKDRYINTALKVAILAKTIEAIVGHLKVLNRWRDGVVNIFAGGLKKCEDAGTLNQSCSFRDLNERNLILKKLLMKSDIEVAMPKGMAPHGRDLIVRFADGSELRVGIDKGMSFWTAVNGGNCSINDYNPNGDIDQKVQFLAGCSMMLGQTEEECPLYVEWHEGKSSNSTASR